MNNEAWNKLYKHLAIEENKKSLNWKSAGRIFPSSAGVNCEVKLRYSFVGENKKSDFIWWGCENKIGNAVHDVIQNNFRQKFGEKVQIELYISYVVEGVKINAKVDLVLNGNKVIEIKTVKSTEGKELKQEHAKQVQWYLGVLGLKNGYVSYFNRENGIHIKTFKVEAEPKVFEHIKEKFAKVIRGDKNLRTDTRECEYCQYSWKCPSADRTPRWAKNK